MLSIINMAVGPVLLLMLSECRKRNYIKLWVNINNTKIKSNISNNNSHQ